MSEPATNAGMNTLVAVAIAPCGTGDELSAEVAEVVRVIRESGLPNRTTSMFTEIEGEYDEVMQVVRDATFVLASKGIRTEVVRTGHLGDGVGTRTAGTPRAAVHGFLIFDVLDGFLAAHDGGGVHDGIDQRRELLDLTLGAGTEELIE